MIHRATPFFYLYPKAYLSTDQRVVSLDIEEWSDEEYTWENDGWGGYKDYVSRPIDTLTSGKGDCDDYAALAASWEHARGNDVKILFLYRDGWPPHPEHVVAVAGGRIYDSGRIWKDTTPDEYLAKTKYDGFISRKV